MIVIRDSNSGVALEEPAVEMIPGVCGGDPVVPGTRIPAALLYEFVMTLGWSVHELCLEYPHVPSWKIVRAIAWIGEHPGYLVEWREGQEQR